MGLFPNIFLRGALFHVNPMYGATTIGAFGEEVTRGVGDTSNNGAFSMAPVKLATYVFGRESSFDRESSSFSVRAAAGKRNGVGDIGRIWKTPTTLAF